MDGTGVLRKDLGPMARDGTYTLALQIGCRLDKPCGGYEVQILIDGTLVGQFTLDHGKQVPGTWIPGKFQFQGRQGADLSIALSPQCSCRMAEVDWDDLHLSYSKPAD